MIPSIGRSGWRCSLLTALALATAGDPSRAAEQPIDFQHQIAPILQQHCLGCHSPGIEKGDLSLATFDDLRANEYVVAGDPDGSYLLELVTPRGGDPPAMPLEADPLSEDEILLLRQWIVEGAAWPDGFIIKEKPKTDATWWSLQPLQVAFPTAKSAGPDATARDQQTNTTIDDFLRETLSKYGLTFNPPADRRTLIRRATYDLIGLPPTPDQVEAFVNDESPAAYVDLIDRLLASPHYGERWGRHWLDVVRFGESNGYERNVIIDDLWPFRDYVIESINDDKPFDQFIREHIAGDVLGKGEPMREIGSAFLVAGPYDNVGNQDPVQSAQIRADTIDEMIRTTSEAFLGMTVGCARCHDHKFDPITQEDYYSMYATFAGVQHGSAEWASPEQRSARAAKLNPLQQHRSALINERRELTERTRKRLSESGAQQSNAQQFRPAVNARRNEETFPAVTAKFVRFSILRTNGGQPCIDELEVYGPDSKLNLALAASGSVAAASSLLPGYPIHQVHHLNDGKHGNSHSWISHRDIGWAQIELANAIELNRVVWGRDLDGQHTDRVPIDYRVEISIDGESWRKVADAGDRLPLSDMPAEPRATQRTADENAEAERIERELADVTSEIDAVPPLPTAWIGLHEPTPGPYHVFIGGSPQREGQTVVPASLSALSNVAPTYRLEPAASESSRRRELAQWITGPGNPLPARVLANRIWQHHFGTGIVNTPNDFGYMGGRPTHPELLDFLAGKLVESRWRLKPMHRLIMLSMAYRQSSAWNASAAKIDGESRWLWRFPPRRLSAEELRDTMLQIASELDTTMGGPGFRLYEYQQDNVATYVPLDKHGPETYRRAVYHQNARASVVDLMTEFDQPDCAFSIPRRAETTTPLQALTLLNHNFTVDMAEALAIRLESESEDDSQRRVTRAFQLAFQRQAQSDEISKSTEVIQTYGLRAFCRALLNSNELLYLD